MAVYFNSEINRRSSNEDSFCVLKFSINHEAAVHVMAVADGMGGLAGGKYYSEAAVRLLNEKLLRLIMDHKFKGKPLDEQTDLLKHFCKKVFQEINQELYTGGLNAGVKGGTTLSLVIRFWHSIIIANCGDSPIYCLKDGLTRLISDIQNAAWQMVLQGKTSEGTQLYYQNKTILLQYLGRREKVEPFVTVLPEDEVDSLILGTDGAFGDLGKDQIGQIIQEKGDGPKVISELFEEAKAGGEEDNQTAIYFRREDAGFRNKQVIMTELEEFQYSDHSGNSGDRAYPGDRNYTVNNGYPGDRSYTGINRFSGNNSFPGNGSYPEGRSYSESSDNSKEAGDIQSIGVIQSSITEVESSVPGLYKRIEVKKGSFINKLFGIHLPGGKKK